MDGLSTSTNIVCLVYLKQLYCFSSNAGAKFTWISKTQMKQGQHSRIRRRTDPITKNTGSLTSISFIQLSNSHYIVHNYGKNKF